MADEQEAIAPVALDTPASEPAVETREAPQEVVNEPVEQAEPETEEAAVEVPEDDDDLEFGFKKYKVPKSLKEGVEALRADYTQKTQGASARQAELDAREARIVEQSKATESELQARATVLDVDAKLKPYEGVDWVAFAAQDPVGSQQHRFYYEQLRDAKNAATKTIADGEQQRTQEAQQATAKRFEEAKAYAQSKIPGWSEDTNTKLMSFVKDEGVPMEFIRDNMSPALVRILHKAWLGDQAMKQAAAPKTPATAAAPLAPLQTVTARSGNATRPSLAQLAKEGRMDEYAAARKAGRTR